MMTSKKRKYNNQRRSTQLTIKSRIQLFYYCLPAILFEFIPTWEPFKKSDWSFGSLQSYLGNEKSFKPIFSVLLFPETEWMRSTYVLRRPLFFPFQNAVTPWGEPLLRKMSSAMSTITHIRHKNKEDLLGMLLEIEFIFHRF